ncbi:hypothetical protein SAMN05216533_5910 [Streptomyces sp. Ag109_O5-10]|nr:hypothetical protein SAMN05216533_5910 [Streptomyces sp. Ag109_O5-10]
MVTFDGFHGLDSFTAAAQADRCRNQGLEAFITTPDPVVTSVKGVEATGQRPPEFVAEADGAASPGGAQIQVSNHILDCQPV